MLDYVDEHLEGNSEAQDSEAGRAGTECRDETMSKMKTTWWMCMITQHQWKTNKFVPAVLELMMR